MKFRLLTTSALALSALAAAPAAAQVNGIGVTDPSIAIASAQALDAGYRQIADTYQAQRTQLDQLQQQRQGLMRQFDTDGDGNLSEAEQAAAQANATAVQQIQSLDQTIAQTQAPITLARVYVIEQLLMQYGAALQQVATQGNVQLVLTPESVIFMAPAVDLTDEVIAALNRLAPAVSTAPPEGWRPQQQSATLYQQVQELMLTAAMQAQAQAQQGAPAAAQPPVQGR